ncbi:hypothetical protein [Streptomyces sp. NPDC007355]|uniref:hypothetical protein n=1 Tax=Streptomyces sp. NPDC007355 TaxID=3364778 RepID=UPI00369C3579
MACAEGAYNKDVAARLGSTEHAMGRWRARFVEHRIAGLGDMPHSGSPRTVTDKQGWHFRSSAARPLAPCRGCCGARRAKQGCPPAGEARPYGPCRSAYRGWPRVRFGG